MKIKRKDLLKATFGVLIGLILIGLGFLSIGRTPLEEVSASTTPKYTLAVTGQRYGKTVDQTYRLDVEGETSVDVLSGRNTYDSFVAYLHGSTVSGTGVLNAYDYISFSDVTIETNLSYCTVTLYNEAEEVIVEDLRKVSANLSDGTYKVKFYINREVKGEAWGSTWSTWLNVSTYFVVDTTAPTISGASTSKTGKYTSEDFTVRASDGGSGLDALYMKRPDATGYVSVGESVTITGDDTYGIYEFYAIDKSGLKSSTHYVFLDNLPPFGMLFAGENMAASGTKTNAEYIKYGASDMGAGIKGMYVKRPNESSYTSYTNKSECAINGTYSFYCEDNVGLRTTVVTITLDNVAPLISCSQTSFYSTYDSDFTITASDAVSDFTLYYKTPSMTEYEAVNGNSYTVDETWSDGKYYFYAEDELGNATSYMWIELSVALPEAQVIKDEENNRYRIVWSDDSTGKLNGVNYTKNAWVTGEGEYTFVLTSKKQRVTSYSFAITHAYKIATVKMPTCLESGYTLYQCKSCTSYYTADYVDATGHNYEESIIEVSCTQDGGTYNKCLNCGDEYINNRVIALGHIYEQETILPTCTERGCQRTTCARCGYSYDTDETYALGHSYVSEVKSTATCTTNGVRFHSCERCGNNYTTEIRCLGHIYELTDEENSTGTTIRTYSCSACGYSYTQDLGNQYEEVSNYVEYLFNQYSPYMIWVFSATAGMWSIGMGVAYIVAQKNEDKQKAKKMLVNYVIGLVIIFVILVAAPYLVSGIAALIAG